MGNVYDFMRSSQLAQTDFWICWIWDLGFGVGPQEHFDIIDRIWGRATGTF